MGFLFGLMIGSALSGSPSQQMAILGSIPLRCLMAFDNGPEAYRNCRRLNLTYEIGQQACNTNYEISGTRCSTDGLRNAIETAMNLEIKALQTMAEASKARQ